MADHSTTDLLSIVLDRPTLDRLSGLVQSSLYVFIGEEQYLDRTVGEVVATLTATGRRRWAEDEFLPDVAEQILGLELDR